MLEMHQSGFSTAITDFWLSLSCLDIPFCFPYLGLSQFIYQLIYLIE